MNRIYILGLAAIFGLSACGESAQDKLARITLEKEKISKIMRDNHFKSVYCKSNCDEIRKEAAESNRIQQEKFDKLTQE